MLFDFVRREHAYLHLWEPGDNLPLVRLEGGCDGREAGRAR